MPESNPVRVALQRAATEIQQVKPTPTHQMALYLVQSIQRHIEIADSISKVKEARDYAQLFALYFKRRRAALIDSNSLRALQLRAERQLGALIANSDRMQGKAPGPNLVTQVTRYRDLLAELEIQRATALRWQHIAEIENQEFELWLDEWQKDGRELTSAAALEYWRAHYYKATPPPDHDDDPKIPPPDDKEIDGDYDLANYQGNLQDLLSRAADLLDQACSMVGERDFINEVQKWRSDVKEIFKEMIEQ